MPSPDTTRTVIKVIHRRLRLPGVLALAVVANLSVAVVALGFVGNQPKAQPVHAQAVAVVHYTPTTRTSKALSPATTSTTRQQPSQSTTTARPSPTTTLAPVAVTVLHPRVAAASITKVGADISWPQVDVPNPGAPEGPQNACRLKPPFSQDLLSGIGFASVGINHGQPMTQNQCLPQEISMLSGVPVAYYANTALPPDNKAMPYENGSEPCPPDIASQPECGAYKFGYSAGEYDVGLLKGRSLHGVVWLDVETGNDWSTSASFNRASIRGVVEAVLAASQPDSGIHLAGMYSTQHQWDAVTGGDDNAASTWRISTTLPAHWYAPGEAVPTGTPFPATWYATAQRTAQAARGYCPVLKNGAISNPHGFTGGLVTLVQYMSDSRIDSDARCSE